MNREDELNAAIDNCRRISAEQVSLNDSKHNMCRVITWLVDTLKETQNRANENEITSTEVKQEDSCPEVHESTINDTIGSIDNGQTHSIQPDNDSFHGDEQNLNVNVLEDTKFEFLSKANLPKMEINLIPLSLTTEPTVIVETQQNGADPIISSENISSPNAMTSAKLKSYENVSTVPIRLQLEARLSPFVPIDVDANEDQHNCLAITNSRGPRISRKKRNNVPSSESRYLKRSARKSVMNELNHTSDEYDENEHTPVSKKACRKPGVLRNKQSQSELGNAFHLKANSFESPENIREPSKKNSGPATDVSILPVQLSPDANEGNKNNLNKDKNGNDCISRPVSAQIGSSVPADSSQKQIITKLFIVISEGIVYYEFSDGKPNDYAPLSEDTASILRESVLSKDRCNVAIQFYACDSAIPCLYRKNKEKPANKFISLEQFKTFAEQIKSIASLWASATVTAHFGRFEKKNNDIPSKSDYRSELFSPDCSILKCKKLRVTLVDNWSSIITDVVGQCEDCELNLKEVSGNCELHNKFLDEVYKEEALQRSEVTIFIRNNKTLDDFKRKLNELSSKPLQNCFKFGLYFYSTKFCLKRLQKEHGTLEAKTVKKANKHHSGCIIIELRATAS